MDPVVVAALEAVSKRVNLRTGLTHPYDRAVATEALELLWQSGCELPRMEIETWALVNGWDRDGVADLGDAVDGVVTGRRSRLLVRNCWRSDALERWRAEASS